MPINNQLAETIIKGVADSITDTVGEQKFIERWAGTISPTLASSVAAAAAAFGTEYAASGSVSWVGLIVMFVVALVTGIASYFTPNGNTPTTQKRTLNKVTKALDNDDYYRNVVMKSYYSKE